MTKEQLKAALPILTAFANGETLQFNSLPTDNPMTSWCDVSEPIIEKLLECPYRWRVKPKPRVMLAHDGDDTLHYCDPPYVHSTRMKNGAHGHHGYSHEMTDEDHRHLCGRSS